MKSILMSINPKWVVKIASGEKTIEVRKTVPKCGTPFKVYIYMTKENKVGKFDKNYVKRMEGAKRLVGGLGKVVGEFVCDFVENIDIPYPSWDNRSYLKDVLCKSCLTYAELHNYGGIDNTVYGLHISDFKIYDKPKELWEFKPICRHKDCLECKHSDIVASYGDFHKIFCMNNSITRPPQSWCYVEEV